MKLNTKRTVLVGFAFLSICAFWQMYDNLVPKILTETFGIGESISGIIYEPWHYRYVGKEVAAEIHDLGVCLEEYLQMLTVGVG